MPRDVSDLYNPDTGRSVDDLYDVGQQFPQPDTTEADKVRTQGPVRRLVSGAVDRMNPLPMLKQVGSAMWNNPWLHKADPLLDAANGMMGMDYAKKAVDDASNGRFLSAMHNAALANPLGAYIAHGYEGIGEQIGSGNIAGAVGTGLGEGLNTAAMGGAFKEGGIGADLMKPGVEAGKNVGRRIYQGALLPNKWFRDLPGAQLKETLDKGLREGIYPNEAGFQQASGHVASISDKIDDIALQHETERLPVGGMDQAASIDTPGYEKNLFSSERRQLADVNKNYRRIKFESATQDEIDAAKQEIANRRNAKAMLDPNYNSQTYEPITPDKIGDAEVKAIDYPSSMTVKDLMDLKRTVRGSLTTPQGRLLASDIVDSMANHVAGSANQTITAAFPELKALGLDDRDWINLRTIIKEAAGKTANRSISGLAGAMTPMAIAVKGVEGATTAGKAAMIGAVMRNPVLRSRVASMVFRASNGATGAMQSMARFAAIDAELGAMEDADQRSAAAYNARP